MGRRSGARTLPDWRVRPVSQASVRHRPAKRRFQVAENEFPRSADIIVMPGVRHEPPEERPEEINAIVLSFLRDIGFK